MIFPARSVSPTTQASASLTSPRSGGFRREEVHGRTGIVARGGDGLGDFVHQRGGQFSHHAHTVDVRRVLTPTHGAHVFRLLALGQIEHEPTDRFPSFFGPSPAEQKGTRLPSLRKYSFSIGSRTQSVVLFDPSCVAIAPVPGGQSFQLMRPAARSLRRIPRLGEGVIGLDNPTIEVPDEDADNVRFHEAADLRFTFCEIAARQVFSLRPSALRRSPDWRPHLSSRGSNMYELTERSGINRRATSNLFAARCLVNKLTHVGGRPAEGAAAPFDRWLEDRVVFENPKGFVRPVKFAVEGVQPKGLCDLGAGLRRDRPHCGAADLRPACVPRCRRTTGRTDWMTRPCRSRKGSQRAWCQRNSLPPGADASRPRTKFRSELRDRSLCGFWKVGRVHERFPTTKLESSNRMPLKSNMR